MRASSRALGLVVLVGLAAAPLSAQSGPAARALSRGSTAPSFESAFPSISVPALTRSASFHLPSELEPIQDAGRNRTKGALWGAGLGLVAGGLLGGLTAGSEEDDGFGEGLVEAAGTGEAVILGALVGAAMGAVLGATIFAPSRSGPAAGAPLAIGLAPRHDRGGTGVGVGVWWRR